MEDGRNARRKQGFLLHFNLVCGKTNARDRARMKVSYFNIVLNNIVKNSEVRKKKILFVCIINVVVKAWRVFAKNIRSNDIGFLKKKKKK